jgi:hypothetical protein
MQRENFISRLGLILGCLVGVVVIGITVYAWLQGVQQASPEPPSGSVQRSSPGWEIRYNATVALARRGSSLVSDRLPVLAEMIDEEQQRHNFRTKTNDGREVPNDAEAAQTVVVGLRAIGELRDRRPELDLSMLYPAINKLAESPNAALRTEARKTKLALGMS